MKRFESDIFRQEMEDFMSDKCPYCMGYINADGECNSCYGECMDD